MLEQQQSAGCDKWPGARVARVAPLWFISDPPRVVPVADSQVFTTVKQFSNSWTVRRQFWRRREIDRREAVVAGKRQEACGQKMGVNIWPRVHFNPSPPILTYDPLTLTNFLNWHHGRSQQVLQTQTQNTWNNVNFKRELEIKNLPICQRIQN